MQTLNQGRQTEIEHVIQQLSYQGDSLQVILFENNPQDC